LIRLCRSVDCQTQTDWQHLVVVDAPRASLNLDQRQILESIPSHPSRSFSFCDRRHKNYGHTCRHQIWRQARGEYILYVDDDDYMAHPAALATLDSVAAPWAVFPILRRGKIFFSLPPGTARTGTGMFIHQREIGRWPDSDLYEADGVFVEGLVRTYPYQALDCAPLMIQPLNSVGVSNAETWLGDKLSRLAGRWIWYRYCIKNRIASRPAKSRA
jgi:hypothetical protein